MKKKAKKQAPKKKKTKRRQDNLGVKQHQTTLLRMA